MNAQRAATPRTISEIVHDLEQQSARRPGTPAVITHHELRRVIGAAVQGDQDAMRLAAIVVHVPVAKGGT